MSKTIKQIADELQVSKQAVWQRVKRSSELSSMLYDHSQTINGTVIIDEDMEKALCELYPERTKTINVDETNVNVDINVDVNNAKVDETSVCEAVNVDSMSVNVDEALDCKGVNVDVNKGNVDINVDEIGINIDEKSVNVDETYRNVDMNVDVNSVNVDVNALIETLQSTVNTLKQQLTIKDKQIDDLSAMLKSSQEQQATLVTALSAAQALHAGTMQERLTEHSESSEIQREVNEAEQESQTVKKGFFARIFGKGR